VKKVYSDSQTINGATMNRKILYIDDNRQNLRLMQKMLNSAGYDVLEATDGISGIAAAHRELPSLILMDINLPGEDGYEVTARIKATPELAGIPVVAVTANSMQGDRERCLAAGCDAYIAKPITKSELLSTVSQYVKRNIVLF
jgi:two-component system, cell cycle response regulator DivK